MTRPAIAAVALVIAAVALAGCSSAPRRHPAQAPPRTVAKTFRPYDLHGDLAVQVADVATGNCWTTSIAAPVAGAYRCIAGNRIYDPCFAPAHPVAPIQVACLEAPWSAAEVLRLTGALPHTPPLSRTLRPWAIQLSNGARCVAITGTVPQVAGVDLGYHCTDGRDAGLTDPRAALVMAEYGAPGGRALVRVTVATIWRG